MSGCLDALAATGGAIPLSQWVGSVGKPLVKQGQRYRALNP